jgi:WD40 repeat protein
VVAGTSTEVALISLTEHRLVDRWYVEEGINAIDHLAFPDGGLIIAFGTSSGRILLRFDWEEIPSSFECKQAITSIKFSTDGYYLIVASLDQKLYIFTYNNNSYFQFAPKELAFQSEVPVSLSLTDDNKMILVGSHVGNLYKIDLPEMKYRTAVQESDRFAIKALSLTKADVTKGEAPAGEGIAVLGNDINFILETGRQGHLSVWKNQAEMRNNCGDVRYAHVGKVVGLALINYQDTILTLGGSDSTLIEWGVKIVENTKDSIVKHSADQTAILDSPMLERELMFCANLTPGLSTLTPSSPSTTDSAKSDPMLLDSFSNIRGCLNLVLNSMQTNYLPPIPQGSTAALHPPPLSLSLQHVYGFEAEARRNTISYCGHEVRDGSLLYSFGGYSRRAVWIVDRVAVVSRVDRKRNAGGDFELIRQQFYQGHSDKISCMTVHPEKTLVATGEASSNPYIHIWNSTTCDPVKRIRTYHAGGIINMIFSYDGKYLASLGMNQNFNLQVCDWQKEIIIAFRYTSSLPIVDLRFNPTDSTQICTCGIGYLDFYSLKGTSLERTLHLALDTAMIATATCIEYLFFLSNRSISTEILVGTTAGDILLASDKTCQVAAIIENAHPGGVTAIRLTCCLTKKFFIYTAGEDGTVKVWDTKLKLHRKIDLFLEVLNKFSATPLDRSMCGIQSISLWHRASDGQLRTSRLPKILIGTRNGFAVELEIEKPLSKEESAPEPSLPPIIGDDEDEEDDLLVSSPRKKKLGLFSRLDKTEVDDWPLAPEIVEMLVNLMEDLDIIHQEKESRYLKSSLLIRGQVSFAPEIQKAEAALTSRGQLSAVHPSKPLLAIVSSNNLLLLWDYEKYTILSELVLQGQATAVIWHPHSDTLVIGFRLQGVNIYEARSAEGLQLRRGLSFVMVSALAGSTVSPVLSLEFNLEGTLLAVSHNNTGPSREDSFVQVYIHRDFADHEGIQTTDQGRYLRYFDIRCPSIHASYENKFRSFGMAVFFMAFSTDSRFLLVFFQLIDHRLRRLDQSSEGIYVLWDIKLNNTVKSWEGQKEASFDQTKFPNHIYGNYRLFDPSPLPPSHPTPRNAQQTVPITFSSIWQMSKPREKLTPSTPLFLGDTHGYVHLAPLGSLSSPPGDNPQCIAAVRRAHSSSIDWLESSRNGDWLFTRGQNDAAIMQWRMERADETTELDFRDTTIEREDVVFGEVDAKDRHNHVLTDILYKRHTLGQLVQSCDAENEGEVYLRVAKVIGRKAYNKRNNLVFTNNNFLIFFSGSMLVSLTIPPPTEIINKHCSERYFRQSFLRPVPDSPDSSTSLSPEISCIAICPNLQTLAVGTYEPTSRLLIWDANSHTFQGTLHLPAINSVLLMAFASDSRTLALLALHNHYHSVLMLVDSTLLRITAKADLDKSYVSKIKAITFLGDSLLRIITLGVLHLQEWTLKSGTLEPRGLEIGLRIAGGETGANIMSNMSDEVPAEQIADKNLTFLSVAILGSMMILAADDGFVSFHHSALLLPRSKSFSQNCGYARNPYHLPHSRKRIHAAVVLSSSVR